MFVKAPSLVVFSNNHFSFYLKPHENKCDISSFQQNPSKINLFSGLPYSQRYLDLYKKRITLPVWEYYEKFVEILNKNKIMVLVGETGSGKTTQVCITKDEFWMKKGIWLNFKFPLLIIDLVFVLVVCRYHSGALNIADLSARKAWPAPSLVESQPWALHRGLPKKWTFLWEVKSVTASGSKIAAPPRHCSSKLSLTPANVTKMSLVL